MSTQPEESPTQSEPSLEPESSTGSQSELTPPPTSSEPTPEQTETSPEQPSTTPSESQELEPELDSQSGTETPTQTPSETLPNPTTPPQTASEDSETPSEPKPTIYGVLTEDQLLEAMYLVSVYQQFWENKKFTSGIEEPVVSLREVEHLLEEAAEIVIQLRTCKDSTAPVDGNSKEYLWALEALPPADEFVRGLIHATLQHSDGTYLDGLSAQLVDQKTSKIVEANLTQDPARHPALAQLRQQSKELEDKLQESWLETAELLKSTMNDASPLLTSSLISDLKQIQANVDAIKRQIDCFKARKTFKQGPGNLNLSTRCKKECPSTPPPTPVSEPDNEVDEDTKKGILKVEMVHKKVSDLNTEITTFSDRVQSEVANKSSLTSKPLESLNHIADMKKKAAIYLEELCRDLDTLDAISGENLRALRKKEVLHVQELIEGVEKVQSQIFKLEEEVKPLAVAEQKKKEERERKLKEKELREEKEREERLEQLRQEELNLALQRKEQEEHLKRKQQEIQRQRAKLQEVAASRQRTPEQTPPRDIQVQNPQDALDIDLSEAWRSMTLDVDLKTQELRDEYVIIGNIPNMDRKDITIKINEDKLIIGGFRGPTREELEGMKRLLSSRRDVANMSKRDVALAILRIGLGRFGKWQQTFSLPAEIDADQIEATYQHGTLKIVLPKAALRRKSQGVIPYGFPFNPYETRQDPRRISNQDPRFYSRPYSPYGGRAGYPYQQGFW